MLEVRDRVWLGIEDRESFGGDEAGSAISLEETLYDVSEYSDGWEPIGDPVGKAHGVFVRTPEGRAITTLILEFDDGSTLVASGSLPVAGSSIGKGILTVVGGTGDLENPLPRLGVDFKNPHKYTPQP